MSSSILGSWLAASSSGEFFLKLRFPASDTSTGVRYPFNIDYVRN